MDPLGLLRRQRYTWRIDHRLRALEQEVDPGTDYQPVRQAFDRALVQYGRARTTHIILALLFYGSLVGSVTAQFGFRIDIFRELSGLLGLGTVFLLYYLSRHSMKLLYADLEHARTRAIAHLAAVQQDGVDGS